MGNFKEDISRVKAFVFDCDGVFTDGKILPYPDGDMLRTYNAKDGYAVTLAISRGYPICLISGGYGKMMELRFSRLGVKDIYLSCHDKLSALNEFASKYNLKLSDIMYMGDDIPDIEPMIHVGLPVAPIDAAAEVKAASRYVSQYKGGEGCVRDVIEQVLKSQSQWLSIVKEKDILSR